VVLRVAGRLLIPVALVLSTVLFLRGHDEPGGGFISALVSGTAHGYVHLAYGPGSRLLRLLRPERLVGAGLVIGLVTGVAPQLAGSAFLTPVSTGIPIPLIGTGLASTLVFELGVFLMVIGLLAAAVERLPVVPGADTDRGAGRAVADRPLTEARGERR
jgi:multicomponent Na+:H+ antiporter subunit A